MRPRHRAARLALALLAAGCSGGTAPTPTGGTAAPTTGTVTTGPPYAVGTASREYVDPDRPTRPNGPAPAAASRRLVAHFAYPASGRAGGREVRPAPGRHPVVVFAHGHNGAALDFAMLFGHLAAAGYVVVAPDFPLSRRGAPGGATVEDLDAQPGDLRLVVDRLAAGDAPAGLGRHVDLDRLAAGGHSLGAVTALRYAYNTCCADGRVRAVVSYAGALADLAGESFTAGSDAPALFVHGDGDDLFVKASRAAFVASPAPAYLVVLEGAGHSPPFKAEEPAEAAAEPVTPHRRVVLDATLAFLEHHVRGDGAGLERLRQATSAPGIATLEER